jgi:hypothetical protein
MYQKLKRDASRRPTALDPEVANVIEVAMGQAVAMESVSDRAEYVASRENLRAFDAKLG